MNQQSRTAATDLLTNYKKKIIEYIDGANQGPDNQAYLEYLSRAQPLPDDKITTTVIMPAGHAWERHEFSFSCPTHVNFFFMGLPMKSAELNILFPKELFGPNQVNPRLIFRTQLPRAWLGGFGAFMGPGQIGMFPFDQPATMAQEIAHNAKENLVDKLCDFINNSNEECAKALRSNIDYLARKWNFLFDYSVQKGSENKIPVPLYVLHDTTAHTSTAVLEVFVRKEMWLPPAEAIMRFLEPLVEAACYFDEKGELFPDGPHYEEDYLLSKIKKSLPSKGTGEEDAVGFSPAKHVERDEFGFVISGGKKVKEFAGSDLGSFGQLVDETRKQQDLEYQKRLMKSETQKQQLQQSVQGITQQFKSAQEWFATFQNKRFKLVGDSASLPIKLKGNVSFLQALNPPFILSFARDQLRLKRSITSTQAQDILFEIFKTGFLQLD